jgi:hypothetical protein
MKQESDINAAANQKQKRVLFHLQRADYLFTFLPVAAIFLLFVVLPILNVIYLKVTGEPDITSMIAGPEIFIIAGMFVSSFLITFYVALALILSLLTRRNITFRILLVAVPVLIVSFFCLQAYLNTEPFVPSENEQMPAESEEIPEKVPEGSGRMKAFNRFKPSPLIPSRLGCKDSLKPFQA